MGNYKTVGEDVPSEAIKKTEVEIKTGRSRGDPNINVFSDRSTSDVPKKEPSATPKEEMTPASEPEPDPIRAAFERLVRNQKPPKSPAERLAELKANQAKARDEKKHRGGRS